MRASLAACLALFVTAATCSGGEKQRLEFDIPTSYGAWSIEGIPGTVQGPRSIEAPSAKKLLVKGEMGWSVALNLIDGNLIPDRIAPGQHGRDLGGLFCSGNSVFVPQPLGLAVFLDLPKSAGQYAVPGIFKDATGCKTVRLADGDYEIAGKDWKIALAVKEGKITATRAGEAGNLPQLQVKDNMVVWPESAAANATPTLTFSANRTSFRRDEEVVAVLNLPQAAAAGDTFTLSATKDGATFEIWSGKASQVKPSRSIAASWPARVLTPGKYEIKAKLGGSEASRTILVAEVPQPIKGAFAGLAAQAGKPIAAADGFALSLVEASASALDKQGDGELCSLRKNMDDATAAGQRAWIFSRKASQPEMTAPGVARDNALLTQSVRCYAAYDGFVQGLPEKAAALPLADWRKTALLPETAVKYGSAIAAGSTLPEGMGNASDIVILEAKGDVAATCATAVQSLRQAGKAAYALCQAKDAWKLLSQGVNGIFIQNADADKALLSAIARVAPVAGSLQAQAAVADKQITIIPASYGSGQYYWLFAGDGGTTTIRDNATCAIDLLSNTEVAMEKDAGGLKLTLEKGAAKFIAPLAAKPSSISIASKIGKAGTASTLEISATISDAAGQPCPAPLPAEVIVTDAKGAQRHAWKDTFIGGNLSGSIVLANNEQAGALSVTVKCLAWTVAETQAVSIPAPKAESAAAALPDIDIVDIGAIRALLNAEKDFTIVIGSPAYSSMAESLVKLLQDKRKTARVLNADELAPHVFPAPAGSAKAAGPATEFPGATIVIGLAHANQLAEQAMASSQITHRLDSSMPAGSGRGVIECAWRAFSLDHDSILVSANDEEGLVKAIDALCKNVLNQR